MRKGYYLWDWHHTKTIVLDADVEFHGEEYAKSQDAFRQFEEAKKHGIECLKEEIAILQLDLAELEKLKREDVVEV